MYENDQELVREIKSNGNWFGKLVIAGTVLALPIGGWFFWTQHKDQTLNQAAFDKILSTAPSADAGLQQLVDLLSKSDSDDVRVNILAKFGKYPTSKAVTSAVPAIAAELGRSTRVTIEAARTLALIGSPAADAAKPQLMAALPKLAEGERTTVVWALAVLKEASAEKAIIEEFIAGRLQAQQNFDPKVISSALGVAKLSTDEILNHKEMAVRTLAAQSLGEVGTRDIVGPLSRLIQFELARPEPSDKTPVSESRNDNVLQAAAAGLGRTADPSAAAPLFDLASKSLALRAVVMESLKRSTGAKSLLALLPSVHDEGMKKEFAKLLAASHDPSVKDALAGFLNDKDAETQKIAAYGLAELGDARAVSMLLTLARDKDPKKAKEALDKLCLIGSAASSAVNTLSEMSRDATLINRRAGVLKALGKIGDASAGPALMDALKTEDVNTAAMSLADIKYGPAFAKLSSMAVRPRGVDFSHPTGLQEETYITRVAAVRALGRFGDPKAKGVLSTIVEDPLDRLELRGEAGASLGAIADDAILSELLTKIKNPSLDENSKRAYINALWQKGSPKLSSDMLALIEDPATQPDLKRALSIAVGYAAAEENEAKLLTLLADTKTEREAAFAIMLGGTDKAVTALVTKLESNPELRSILQDAVLGEGNQHFEVITKTMFESGIIFKRLRAAKTLHESKHSYAWTQLVSRLKNGYDGVDGIPPAAIRDRLHQTVVGQDPALSELAAEALASMDETGLLMAVRDAGGTGSELCRRILRRLSEPTQAETTG